MGAQYRNKKCFFSISVLYVEQLCVFLGGQISDRNVLTNYMSGVDFVWKHLLERVVPSGQGGCPSRALHTQHDDPRVLQNQGVRPREEQT